MDRRDDLLFGFLVALPLMAGIVAALWWWF
jgi:hypothetical protein